MAFIVVSSAIRCPYTLPVLPRISSGMSGFFFCGIIDEPVEYSSAISKYPNSSVEYNIMSSHNRERWLIIIEQSNRNSATKSRSETPSSEFSHGMSNSSSSQVRSRSMGYEVPASAPLPSGITFALSREALTRSMSRRNISEYALKKCPAHMGCAFLRWVYPGIISLSPSPALRHRLSTSHARLSVRQSNALRAYSLKSVATWSLRERAVCSFLPALPMRSTSLFSTKECMSSAPSISSLPAAMSSAIEFSPSHISLLSCSVIMPQLPSIVACAIEAAISTAHSRQSKGSESLNMSAFFAVGASNRPSHSFICKNLCKKLT